MTGLAVGAWVTTRLPDRDTPLAQRPVWGDMNSGEVLAIAGENVTVAWASGVVSTVAATTLTPLAPGEEPIWMADFDAVLQIGRLAETGFHAGPQGRRDRQTHGTDSLRHGLPTRFQSSREEERLS